MVIVLLGLGLIILGVVLAIPKMLYIVKCKESVVGTIEDIYTDTGAKDRAVKVFYSYIVEGKIYKKHTGWTNYGMYKKGGQIVVKYNEDNPQKSYLSGTGMVIKIIVGLIFLIVGLCVIFVGAVVGL